MAGAACGSAAVRRRSRALLPRFLQAERGWWAMGNCCGTAAPISDRDNVHRKKGQRLANWSKTGVIALRRAGLAVRRLHAPAQRAGARPAASHAAACTAGRVPASKQATLLPPRCRSCLGRSHRCRPHACWTPR